MTTLDFHANTVLSRGNRALVTLLLRRYGQWDPADRYWLRERLRAEDLAAFKRSK